MTLAWTDAPGSTTGAANNDLDLTVAIGGLTYKGNVFLGSFSTTGGSADAVDNVESVFLPAGVSGPYTVTITGTSINSPALPNANNEANQDFALVIYNAGGASTLVAGSTALIQGSCSNGVINPGETVTVNLGIQNIGSASTTNLVATLLATNGIAFPSGARFRPAGAGRQRQRPLYLRGRRHLRAIHRRNLAVAGRRGGPRHCQL